MLICSPWRQIAMGAIQEHGISNAKEVWCINYINHRIDKKEKKLRNE